MIKTIVSVLMGLLACSSISALAAERIPVSVSIAPQAFFAEKVGGDRISVHVLLPPGRNPATYAPTPAHVSQLTRSRLLFRIGVPFETGLLPGIEQTIDTLEIVDTRKGITLHKNSQVTHAQGIVGNFVSTIDGADGNTIDIEHGVAVMATGAGVAATRGASTVSSS